MSRKPSTWEKAMHQKAEHLHIRASGRDKALLARAAQAKHLSVSQFILQTSVPVAEEILRSDVGSVQTLFRLDAAAWEEFSRLLDAPTREIPELRALL
ncbi:MAG: DUF1778 domain-containing protein, partial [Fimbriimonadales bacterium]